MAMKAIWVCSDCGSTNVQTKKWVDLNTNEIKGDVSDGEPQDNWCDDCKSHTDVTLEFIDHKS